MAFNNFANLTNPQQLSIFDQILGSLTNPQQGAGCIGYNAALAYPTGSIGKALQGIYVTPTGAVGDNVADDTAAFAAALATGKDVFVPEGGIYKITSSLLLANPYQRIFSTGWGAQINFALNVASPGIITSNSTGWQRIENLYLNGVSNCTKVISVGSPDLTIQGCFVLNTTATGHGIYQEDEAGPTTFVFDLRVEACLIYGVMTAGNYGIRLGANHQGTNILRNSVQNWGYLLYINGATSITTISYNIFQRSDTLGAAPAAIAINRTGSGMPVYNVGIEHNYFEQNLVPLYVNDCSPINLTFRKNYCYRNTASSTGSAMYFAGPGTAATAARIHIDENYADSFFTMFSLNNPYSSNITSARDNTFVGGTTYATGTYAANAYQIRGHNGYFGAVLTAGAFTSQAVVRQEVASTTFRIPFRWDTHEYLENIQFDYVSVGSTPSVNLNLHQVIINTDTVIATTGVITANGIITLAVNAYAATGAHFYLEFVCLLGGGTTAYVYPALGYIRS